MTQPRDGAAAIGRLVLAGFAGMLLSFTIAMLSTQLMASGVHSAANDIVNSGSPSIARLVAVRTDLRHLEITLDDAVERHIAGKTLEADALAVARGRRQLAEQWKVYRAAPGYPGARSLQPLAEENVEQLLAAVDRAMLARNPAVAERALDDAKRAADRLDGSIRSLQDLNLDENHRLAMTIGAAWQRSVVASHVAVAVVMILSILTAWAVVRLVRQSARQLEERANEYEAFAGRVAHDLANPIAAARMTLALAHETMPPSVSSNALLDRIAATLGRASAMLQDLYRYAEAGRASRDKESRADVAEVLRGVVEQARPTASRQDVEILVEDWIPATVACRPGVLISIVSNLVDNALKHMGHSAKRRIAVHVREITNRVRIEVEDFGPGIEPALIGHIFDPYVRGSTSASGLGLGLATVKRLTEGHGGKVGVRSSIGKGSVFWLELPKAGTRIRARGAGALSGSNAPG